MSSGWFDTTTPLLCTSLEGNQGVQCYGLCSTHSNLFKQVHRLKAERQEATALVCVRCHVLPLSLSLYGSRAPSTAHTHSWRTTRRRPHRARCVVGSHVSAGWVCTAHTSPAPSPSPTPDLRGWLCEGRAPGGHRPCVCTLPRPPPLPLPLWFPRSIHRTHTQLEDDTAEAPPSKVCSGQSHECGVGVHSTHLTSSLSLSHSRPQRLAVCGVVTSSLSPAPVPSPSPSMVPAPLHPPHTHSWRTTRRRPHRARCVVVAPLHPRYRVAAFGCVSSAVVSSCFHSFPTLTWLP